MSYEFRYEQGARCKISGQALVKIVDLLSDITVIVLASTQLTSEPSTIAYLPLARTTNFIQCLSKMSGIFRNRWILPSKVRLINGWIYVCMYVCACVFVCARVFVYMYNSRY